MNYTTLNKIRAYKPCSEGWRKLLTNLNKTQADDEQLSLLTILQSNNLDNALWALRVSDASDKDIRLFAVWCARQVQHLADGSSSVIDVAERFANGNATSEELTSARASARASASDSARALACVSAWDSARASARALAWDSASDSARASARALAWDSDSDWASAWDSARALQKEQFIKMFCAEEIE